MMSRYEIDQDYVEEGLKQAQAIKQAALDLGAERMVIGQAIAGQFTGEWIAMTRAPDMATLEKILRTLPQNENFQAMIGSGKVRLKSRGFVDIADGF
jgi:hypothetical protein